MRIMSFKTMLVCFLFTFLTMNVSFADEKLAMELTNILRSSRKVFIQKKELIRGPTTSGITTDLFIKMTKKNYFRSSGIKLKTKHPLVKILLSSIRTVMDKAFSGEYKSRWLAKDNANYFHEGVSRTYAGKFLPARYARMLAEDFNLKAAGKARIKLTAPIDLLSNKLNAPDTWESKVIEEKFKKIDWVKNKTHSEESVHDGKAAYRLILPEYYATACLSCHQGAPGKALHKKHPASGVKLNHLGGAISVVIYK